MIPRMRYLFQTFLILLLTAGCIKADPPRLKILSVEFEGNQALNDKSLHDVMICKPSRFLRPSYYDENTLQDDLRNMTLFYEQRGYLQAKITGQHVDIDSVKNQVRIFIEVSEGNLTRVDSVVVLGNTEVSSEILLLHSTLTKGSPFLLAELERTRGKILKLYSEKGYLDAKITTDVSIDTSANLAFVKLILQEKSQYTIHQIHVEGLVKTHPSIVRREMRFNSGNIVNFSSLLETQRRLYGTGLFRSVFIHPVTAGSGDSTQKDILIEVKEDRAGEFNAGINYGTVEKFRLSSELSYKNLFGRGVVAGLDLTGSSRERSIEPFVTQPWILGLPVSANISTPFGILNEPGFTLQAYSVDLALGYAFARRSSIELDIEAATGKLSNAGRPLFEDTGFDTLAPEIQDLILNNLKANVDLESVTLTLVFDKRNNLFNTTDGSYMEFSTGYTRSFLIINVIDFSASNTNDFLRHVAILKYFYPGGDATTFATSVELGMINNLSGPPRSIPPSELFFAGGPNSLRGFEYEKVGPLDAERDPLGGRVKFVWNFEVRQRLYKIVDGLAFVDAGNVWESPPAFKPNDIRYDTGLGLRVFTPLGYLRLDYGINLSQQRNESRGQLWFGLGQAF